MFVGKVTSGEELDSPTTKFDVDVLLNLKGNTENHVTVNQAGGFLDGRLCLVNNDPLLGPGAVYLLSTTHDSSFPLYAVTASATETSGCPTATPPPSWLPTNPRTRRRHQAAPGDQQQYPFLLLSMSVVAQAFIDKCP